MLNYTVLIKTSYIKSKGEKNFQITFILNKGLILLHPFKLVDSVSPCIVGLYFYTNW